MSNIENMVLEHLKKIQGELADARERDVQMLSRLASIESSIARLNRDNASSYAEMIEDRHAGDRIRERLDRIERRLEIIG